MENRFFRCKEVVYSSQEKVMNTVQIALVLQGRNHKFTWSEVTVLEEAKGKRSQHKVKVSKAKTLT
jgi:hypothetical protein